MEFKEMSSLVATDYGKNICWSIPYHELKLIPEMDRRASLKNLTRSQGFFALLQEYDTFRCLSVAYAEGK